MMQSLFTLLVSACHSQDSPVPFMGCFCLFASHILHVDKPAELPVAQWSLQSCLRPVLTGAIPD